MKYVRDMLMLLVVMLALTILAPMRPSRSGKVSYEWGFPFTAYDGSLTGIANGASPIKWKGACYDLVIMLSVAFILSIFRKQFEAKDSEDADDEE